MLIPIKCFTCGKVIANKYRFFQQEVRKIKQEKGVDDKTIEYLTSGVKAKTPEGEVLDKLGLNKYCCRRHILTHVDIN
jgi:DNA-directed RNA polymerase I, II, and III subunit RPABC5